jgi:hypothetical protein
MFGSLTIWIMQHISLKDGSSCALTSLLSMRLVLLAGAGLSTAPPSSLPSAAEIANRAKQKYDSTYGSAAPPIPNGIEDQAEYFFRRQELDSIYFRTMIDHHAFAGPPNQGHYAVADLLLVNAIQTAATTNVDSLIETAGAANGGRSPGSRSPATRSITSCCRVPFSLAASP